MNNEQIQTESKKGSTKDQNSSIEERERIDTDENIFLFIPNIIGYFRIIFALMSFYYMQSDYIKAIIFYVTSSLLDAFDGYAARYFNQATKFGAMLDQLTDRVALLALVMNLCVLYPRYLFFLQLSAIIDISSHWMYIWAGCIQGKSSHKLIDPSQSKILNIYYTSRPVLFFMCMANEIFYCSLYLLHFTVGPIVPALNIGLFKLLFLFVLPFSLIKSLISVIHLIVASINIGIIDGDLRQTKAN